MSKINRYLEAFKESYNVVGLAAAASATLALAGTVLMPIPILACLVAEAAYLLFVPDTKWYQQRLAKKYDAEVEARRQELKNQVLPQLRPAMQARFERLEQVRASIGHGANEDKEWYREVLRKLDFLLEKFLHFALKDVQFRDYLEAVKNETAGQFADPAPTNDPRRNMRSLKSQGASRRSASSISDTDEWVNRTVAEVQARYETEIHDVEAIAAAEGDTNTRAVLEKRIEVLKRRREFMNKIGRILINLNHQLCLLEDTFGLISDEIRARPPQQVLADIEDVVSQTNTMTQVLEEMAPYEQLLAS